MTYERKPKEDENLLECYGKVRFHEGEMCICIESEISLNTRNPFKDGDKIYIYIQRNRILIDRIIPSPPHATPHSKLKEGEAFLQIFSSSLGMGFIVDDPADGYVFIINAGEELHKGDFVKMAANQKYYKEKPPF